MTRILVPVDGSEPSREALEYAHETFPDATITALYVVHMAGYWSGFTTNVEAMPGYEEARAEGEEVLADIRESVDEDVDLETGIEAGAPPEVIVEYVEKGDFHTIVMGSHGRDGVSRILLGSVAERVARRSPIPVTIVR
jgi:nucleotide-binding universal stress UspA family protein